MKKTYIFIIVILLILIMAGIVHKAVKSSGEKGLATEWNDNHEITGDVDVDQNQFLNNVIENRTDFPAGPVEGQIIYRIDLNLLYTFDGTSWESCVMAESDQTITGNKTFSGDQIFTGDVTIDIQSGDVFELKDDFYSWIKYDYADGTMSMGEEIGGDWTEIDFYGTIGFNRTPNIINPAPTLDGDVVHKKYVDDRIAIVKGTHYWSCPGSHFFLNTGPDPYDLWDLTSGNWTTEAADRIGTAAVFGIPDGAVITGVIVYASISNETWTLYRHTLSTGANSVMATASTNSEDTSISNPAVDSSTYTYWLGTSALDAFDVIRGARIKYTL